MQATSVTLYFLVATFLKKETKEINFNIFHFTSYICCVNTQSLSTTLFIFSPKSSKIQQTSIHSRHVSSFQLLLLQETSLLRSVLRKSCFHWCPSLKHKLLVWVSVGATITKYHKLGGLSTTETYFSKFWRLDAPDRGAGDPLAQTSHFVLMWWKDWGALWGLFYKSIQPIDEGATLMT